MSKWNEDGSKRRRDRLYIIAEILEIARAGVLKTQIMYKANLSFVQLNAYLNMLVQISLLEVIRKNGKKIYKTTEKGLSYLERYKGVVQLLDDKDGNNSKNAFKNISVGVIKNIRYFS